MCATQTRSNHFFYGWVVVACAFIVLFLSYGVQYSFGVFVPAMVADLDSSPASLGGAFSLYSAVYTIVTIVSGRVVDVFGPRAVIAVGGVLLGIGIMVTSKLDSASQLYFWYGIVAALGMSTTYLPCNITVVRWFKRRRGLAAGIASSGASVGILVVPLVAVFLIDISHWRNAMFLLGLVLMVVTVLAAQFMVSDPEKIGLRPDGDRPAPATEKTTADRRTNLSWTFREARATASFWLFLLGFAIALLTMTVPFVHIPAYASDIGLSPIHGASAVSVIGLFSLLGGLGLGAYSDHIGVKRAILIALAAQIVAFVLLSTSSHVVTLYLGTIAFGIFYGGFATLFPVLVAALFGPQYAGTIGGFIIGGAGAIGAWGPAITGYLRDAYGSYQVAFAACLGVAFAAAVLFALLPRPQRKADEQSRAT